MSTSHDDETASTQLSTAEIKARVVELCGMLRRHNQLSFLLVKAKMNGDTALAAEALAEMDQIRRRREQLDAELDADVTVDGSSGKQQPHDVTDHAVGEQAQH